MLKESDFRQEVIDWCRNHINELPKRIDSLSKANLNRLCVENRTIRTGWIAWSQYSASREWIWKPFYREVDIIIGLFDTIFTEWNITTKRLLGKLIDFKLEYLLHYWEF